MTIRELYDWAEKHDALDLNIMKNVNLDLFEIEEAHRTYYKDWGFEVETKDIVILD